MADLEIKQHDIGATVEILLEEWNADTGSWQPVDLTSVTQVKLLMKAAGVALVSGIGEVVDVAGIIGYTWDGDDLDFAGSYQVEVELERTVDVVETVPNNYYLDFEVVADLG